MSKLHKYALYARYKDQLGDIPQVEIDLFRFETERAFERIPVTVDFVDGQPYEGVFQMTYDILANKRMRISTLNNNSALLPDLLNLKARAVHDWLHFTLQQGFDFKGECNVYKAQKMLHSTETGRKMLKSEVCFQAAYATVFGKFPDAQKVIINY